MVASRRGWGGISAAPLAPIRRKKNSRNQPFFANVWIFAPSETHFPRSLSMPTPQKNFCCSHRQQFWVKLCCTSYQFCNRKLSFADYQFMTFENITIVIYNTIQIKKKVVERRTATKWPLIAHTIQEEKVLRRCTAIKWPMIVQEHLSLIQTLIIATRNLKQHKL